MDCFVVPLLAMTGEKKRDSQWQGEKDGARNDGARQHNLLRNCADLKSRANLRLRLKTAHRAVFNPQPIAFVICSCIANVPITDHAITPETPRVAIVFSNAARCSILEILVSSHSFAI